ncbi:MAG: P-loop NTPase fold protein, partial [Candidatus Binatia bacterium]
RGAAPQLLDKITRSMLEVSGTPVGEYDKSQQRLGTATKFLESFSASMSVPPALEDWLQDQLIGGLSKTEGESPRAHVVFIDDLDRCEYDYNARLLAATNYWAGRAGFTVFFIIAASRDHVVRSLASQDSLTAALSGVALEKYIHVAIEMPNLLITRTEIANFVGSLFGQIHERMRSSLETMLLRSAEKYPDSVLAPLLQDGGNSCTPRAVKSRFNTFQTEFRPQSPQAELTERTVKEWVIKAFWPSFWWGELRRLQLELPPVHRLDAGSEPTVGISMVRERAQLLGRIKKIIEYGSHLMPLYDLTDDELRAALQSLARKDGVDVTDLDPRLAIYLAASPVFELPEEAPKISSPVVLDVGKERSRVDDEILGHYVPSEAALARGDYDECLEHVHAIATLARTGRVSREIAVQIGNTAITARQLSQPELAVDLFHSAMRANPSNFAVKQNYVDLVVADQIESEYSQAEQVLGELRRDGAQHRPDRTDALDVRLRRLRREDIDADALLHEQLASVRAEPTIERLVQFLSLGAGDLISYGAVEEASQIVAARMRSDVDTYTVLRLLGDAMGTSSNRADEEKSADVYRYLLCTGLACASDATGASDVKHNLATILNSMGYRQAAAEIWREAYVERSGDPSVRRSFALCLQRLGFDAAATAALAGQRLPEFPLKAEALPVKFSKDGRWWEKLAIDSRDPCPTDIGWLCPSGFVDESAGVE